MKTTTSRSWAIGGGATVIMIAGLAAGRVAYEMSPVLGVGVLIAAGLATWALTRFGDAPDSAIGEAGLDDGIRGGKRKHR